jgi:hypothetical protein
VIYAEEYRDVSNLQILREAGVDVVKLEVWWKKEQ